MRGSEVPEIPIVAAEPLAGDDFYLVSGDAITVMRDGKAVPLRGAYLKQVRRWVVDRATPGEPPATPAGRRRFTR